MKTDPIREKPLRVAVDSYIKARELDDKGKLDGRIKDNLIEVNKTQGFSQISHV